MAVKTGLKACEVYQQENAKFAAIAAGEAGEQELGVVVKPNDEGVHKVAAVNSMEQSKEIEKELEEN